MHKAGPFTAGLLAAFTAHALWLAPAATALGRDCTIVGTDAADVLRGTDGSEVICGRAGRDTNHREGR